MGVSTTPLTLSRRFSLLLLLLLCLPRPLKPPDLSKLRFILQESSPANPSTCAGRGEGGDEKRREDALKRLSPPAIYGSLVPIVSLSPSAAASCPFIPARLVWALTRRELTPSLFSAWLGEPRRGLSVFGSELLQASLQKCMPTILHAFCSPASPGTKCSAQPHGIGGGGGQARSKPREEVLKQERPFCLMEGLHPSCLLQMKKLSFDYSPFFPFFGLSESPAEANLPRCSLF